MRWRTTATPEVGDERQVDGFLFLPIKLVSPDGHEEWRWWESAQWTETLVVGWFGCTTWRKNRWVNA